MTIGWVKEIFSRRIGKPAAAAGPANGHLSSSSSTANAQLLRAMDATTRCIISLGRPSGCGMPGSVAAAPLAQLLGAATAHMQQCLLQHKQQQQQHTWSFVDIGAGAGRMLLAAKLFGASSCAGIELCDLTHTFEACKARCIKKGLLQPAAAHSCRLHVGDASTLSTASVLLGEAAPAESAVMVSLIDEGMPLSVREHAYSFVAQDPRVCVVVTVNYRSRAAHLPAVLTGAGFQLAQEMPAPLMGGKCSTAGRIFVRTQPPQPQRRVLPKPEQEQQVKQQRLRQSARQQEDTEGTSSVDQQQPTRRSQRSVRRPPAGRS